MGRGSVEGLKVQLRMMKGEEEPRRDATATDWSRTLQPQGTPSGVGVLVEGLEGRADTAGVGEEMVGLVGGAEMVGKEVGLTFQRQGFKGP
jgi:hypothetical protein